MVSRWWNEDWLESCFHKSNFWAQLRGSSVIISRHEMRRKGKWNLDEKLSVQTFKWPQVGISKLSTQTWREYWNMSWWGICWRSLALVLCKWKWSLRWPTQTSNTQWDGQLFQKKCTDKLAIQDGQLEYEVQWKDTGSFFRNSVLICFNQRWSTRIWSTMGWAISLAMAMFPVR